MRKTLLQDCSKLEESGLREIDFFIFRKRTYEQSFGFHPPLWADIGCKSQVSLLSLLVPLCQGQTRCKATDPLPKIKIKIYDIHINHCYFLSIFLKLEQEVRRDILPSILYEEGRGPSIMYIF